MGRRAVPAIAARDQASMSDIDRLRAAFEAGALLRPSTQVPNVVDLARALACLGGSPEMTPTAGASDLARLIGPADHLVFIVADGLGMMLVDSLPGSTFFAAHLERELRTVFPSTTATVLTALATGAWPGQHGVTGQWTHLPAIRGTADLLRFAARGGGVSLTKLGVSVEQAFPLPALMGGLQRDTLALFPEGLANGSSSIYFSGERPRRAYRTLAEATEIIGARVETTPAPTYTYLYTPWIDQEAHRHGVRHPGVRAAVIGLDREFGRLAARLGGRARIVLTADHGLLDTPIVARHWLKPTADLFETLLFPPSGDARVMYLHVKEGARDWLRERFQRRYGERFFVLTIEEAEQLELFGPGPLSPRARDRMGDLIVISSGVDVIEYVPAGSHDRVLSITAHHSGLTPAEMRVPLIIA